MPLEKSGLRFSSTFHRPGRAGWTVFEDHSLRSELITNGISALKVFGLAGGTTASYFLLPK